MRHIFAHMKNKPFHLAVITGLAFMAMATLFSSDPAQASTPLSNTLPRDLVRELVDSGNWDQRFDENSQEAQDLNLFWSRIHSSEAPAGIIDQLFGTHTGVKNPSVRYQLPRLYPVKVIFLRYFTDHEGGPRPEQLNQAWLKRYVETALTTIDMAGIREFNPIANSFQELIRDRKLILRDLSPAERRTIREQVLAAEQVDVLSQNAANNKFQITGIYRHDTKYFAIDLARPIQDTLITFAHEMIHAADPELQKYRETYSELLEPTLRIFSRWLSAGFEDPEKNPALMKSEDLILDIVQHFFLETGLNRFKETADAIRVRRLGQLRDSLDTNTEFRPTENELTTVQDWLGAAVGLTIANEYRAYSLSTLLYAVLKNRIQVLEFNPERQEMIEKLLSGDDVIATQVAVSANPFLSARSEVFRRFMGTGHADRANPANPQDRLVLLRVGRILDQLEFLYLKRTEAFLKNLNHAISDKLREFPANELSRRNVLPKWAQPGGFDLPSNPFNVLSARITTAWVLRFRSNLELFTRDLKEINEPLLTLRYGILDLHDLTKGERKLIGISYADSPWASDPDLLTSRLLEDLDRIPQEVSKHFGLTLWTHHPVADDHTITGKQVIVNLIRLRMLKAAFWLDQAFPPVHETIVGTKSFLQRLREGLFNEDEISPERVKELQQELIGVWNQGSISQDEILHMRLLLTELSRLHEAAALEGNSQWLEISNAFLNKSRFVRDSLEALGVAGNATDLELRASDQRAFESLSVQLKPYEKQCRKTSAKEKLRLGGLWSEKGPFALGESGFPLTILCYHGDIYLIRQPGDYITSLTTLIRNQAPEIRVFKGGRPVRLTPIERAPRSN